MSETSITHGEWMSGLTKSGFIQVRFPGSSMRKQRLANLGLCYWCMNPLGRNTVSSCPSCVAKRRGVRSSLRASGRCPRCGGPKRAEMVRCCRCSGIGKKQAAKHRAGWKIQGLCSRCGRTRRVGLKTCALCALDVARYWRSGRRVMSGDKIKARERLRYASRVQSGICIKCPGAAEAGRSACRDCLNKRAERRKSQRRIERSKEVA